MIINDEIITIKDLIVANADCEQVYLFGSYAYGRPGTDSDYDFYVVLNDGAELPILVMQTLYRSMAGMHRRTPVDILAQYKRTFEERRALLTIERTVVNKGVLLYDTLRRCSPLP
ncbi:hypothetical protein FACS1894109_05910 [Spirochaetia bacterium]|nr:hypothetical protein FACS1894109_05910 [Spirochaetia bacterium]